MENQDARSGVVDVGGDERADVDEVGDPVPPVVVLSTESEALQPASAVTAAAAVARAARRESRVIGPYRGRSMTTQYKFFSRVLKLKPGDGLK
ncbi:MAG: hypothetical protein ACI9YT_000020 [Halobacteriales archaeon]